MEPISEAALNSFKEEGKGAAYQILDYEGKNARRPLPLWVRAYLDGGVAAVEALFRQEAAANANTQDAPASVLKNAPKPDKYLFVSAQKSASLDALLQWKNNFKDGVDSSAYVFPRIYRRTVLGLPANPEQFYGHFWIEFLKAASSKSWSAAGELDSIWITFSTASPRESLPALPDFLVGAAPSESEAASVQPIVTNMSLTLAGVEKAVFEKELIQVMDAVIKSDKSQTKENKSAVNRLKSAFFDGF
jgi:hypothetical protein